VSAGTFYATPHPLVALLSRTRRVNTCLVWRNADTVERARRCAFTLLHGPLPPGRELRNRCGTPWCVNPFHQQAHRVNIRNGVTHCVNGHEYREGSYYLQNEGRARVCKACFRERRRAWRQRQRHGPPRSACTSSNESRCEQIAS
jgi:hypothetical protein